MPMYMCRWPNGDVSFVTAKDRMTAVMMLDEVGSTTEGQLMPVKDFMLHLRLQDDGELAFEGLGEKLEAWLWKEAYPLLHKAMVQADEDHEGERPIREAVIRERQRLARKDDFETGDDLNQTDMEPRA